VPKLLNRSPRKSGRATMTSGSSTDAESQKTEAIPAAFQSSIFNAQSCRAAGAGSGWLRHREHAAGA
jgi:hypothetical protein